MTCKENEQMLEEYKAEMERHQQSIRDIMKNTSLIMIMKLIDDRKGKKWITNISNATMQTKGASVEKRRMVRT